MVWCFWFIFIYGQDLFWFILWFILIYFILIYSDLFSYRDQTGSNYKAVAIQTKTMRFQATSAALLVLIYSKPDISALVGVSRIHIKDFYISKSWQKGLTPSIERLSNSVILLSFPCSYLSWVECWSFLVHDSLWEFYSLHPCSSNLAHRGYSTNCEYLSLIWSIERCSDS